MELEYREDHTDAERPAAERSQTSDPVASPMPFASDGLEQLRDSHC